MQVISASYDRPTFLACVTNYGYI